MNLDLYKDCFVLLVIMSSIFWVQLFLKMILSFGDLILARNSY